MTPKQAKELFPKGSFWNKHAYNAIVFPEGAYPIGSVKIETRFCFPDEPYSGAGDADDWCSDNYKYYNSKDGFLAENKKAFLRKFLAYDKLFIVYLDGATEVEIIAGDINNYYLGPDDKFRELTEEEKDNYVSIVKEEYERFIKRLEAYWKRYGNTKLHVWSYWADR